MQPFSHIDTTTGHPTMVDVSPKTATSRTAVAQALVHLPPDVLAALETDAWQRPKGPVFQTAVLAGIMGAKRTGDLIPLCHPLGLENCAVHIGVQNNMVRITCTATLTGKTGVEMEALTGATIAALTVYDMCKALSHDIVIREVCLLSKTGGKRDFNRENP